MADDKFCRVDQYSVLIPYSDLVKMVDIAKEVDQIKDQYSRLQEQYAAIQGMFSECLLKIREIRDFVGNS